MPIKLNINVLSIFILISTSVFFSHTLYAGSYLNWKTQWVTYSHKGQDLNIRAGFVEANPNVNFKGNVLYYQGLADSMLNHDPLFEVLSHAGYRVVGFDYMGQGKSQGSMNDTRIENINELGDLVISQLARKSGAGLLKYHIIGWSTGGLAAYRKANIDKGQTVSSVTLIAPGISPRVFTGEGLFNWPINEITMRTLTSNTFVGSNDPHEDPISPSSPLSVRSFSFNLLKTAVASRWFWEIQKSVKGFVLLSDPEVDTYVNSKETVLALKRTARYFDWKFYPGARHEIDNEQDSIAIPARQDVLEFLESVYGSHKL